jgi:ribose transport system ATP-binding protein
MLDEPTSALSRPEVEWLFALLRQCRDDGIALVLISHRMSEIRDLCDRVTILRNGQQVGTFAAGEISDAEIVQRMIGRSMAAAFPERTPAPPTSADPPLLEVRHLGVPPSLLDASIAVRAGEVVGIAGLEGQGQRQLFHALAGIEPASSGEIIKGGHPIRLRSPIAAIRHGIALVPGDRAREGLLLPLSVTHNMSLPTLPRVSHLGLIDEAAERSRVAKTAAQVGLAAERIESPVDALSGGNQQKVLLGKWVLTDADVLAFEDPTQGVDVGTKYEISSLVLALAASGKGVLYYSTDLDELTHLAHRVVVFYRGRVQAELSGQDVDPTQILTVMTGHQAATEPVTGGQAVPA